MSMLNDAVEELSAKAWRTRASNFVVTCSPVQYFVARSNDGTSTFGNTAPELIRKSLQDGPPFKRSSQRPLPFASPLSPPSKQI